MKTQNPIIKIRSGALETNSSSAHAWVWTAGSQKKSQSVISSLGLSPSKQLRLDFSNLSPEDSKWSSNTIKKLGYFHNALQKNDDHETLKEMYRLLCLKTGAQSLLIIHNHSNDEYDYTGDPQEIYGFFDEKGEFVLQGHVDVLMEASIGVLNNHLGKHSLCKSKNAAESLMNAALDENLQFYQYHDDMGYRVNFVNHQHIQKISTNLAKKFGMEHQDFIDALEKAFPDKNAMQSIEDFATGYWYGCQYAFKNNSHPFKMTWDEFTQTVKNAMAKKVQVCYYGVGHNS